MSNINELLNSINIIYNRKKHINMIIEKQINISLLMIGGSPDIDNMYSNIVLKFTSIGNHKGAIMEGEDWDNDTYWDKARTALESKKGIDYKFDCIMFDPGSGSWLYNTNKDKLGNFINYFLKDSGIVIADKDEVHKEIFNKIESHEILRRKFILMSGVIDQDTTVYGEMRIMCLLSKNNSEILTKLSNVNGIENDWNGNVLSDFSPKGKTLLKNISTTIYDLLKKIFT